MKKIPFISLMMILGIASAEATQDQDYGLGGSTSGRASSVTAEPENPYAALYNPALLAAQAGPLFAFSTSAASSHFDSIRAVLIDSPRFRTQDSVSRVGNYQPPDTQTTLWAAGLSYPFALSKQGSRHAGLGVVVSGPYDRLRSLTSSTPYDFSPLHYGTSDSQFKATLSAGVEVFPDVLYAGAGLSLYLTSSGAADASLFANNPTGRLDLDVGLNTAAVAGVFGKAGDNHFSLVYREAVNPAFQQTLSAQVQVGGDTAFHQPFLMRTSLYYEPQTIELEWQRDLGPLITSVGVSYQMWASYQPSFLMVETQESGGTKATEMPDLGMHNTWNPRASVEVPLFRRRVFISAGYQFRPSPVGDLSGEANLLDADAHIIGLSFEHRLAAGDYLPFPLTWGVFAQYHQLIARSVHKANVDFIGSPDYEIGGRAYVYGLSLRAEL